MQWATRLQCGPRKGLLVGDRQHRRRPVFAPRALDGRAQQAFGSGSSGPFKGLSLQQQQQLAQQGQQAQQQQQVSEEDQQQRAAAAAGPGNDAQRAASPPPGGIAGHGDLLAEWTAWTAFFEEMDSNGNALDQVALQLQRAVVEERYADAARLQGRAAALAAGDAAAALRKHMGEALEAEDYAAAAALRDEGYAWLEGWWWGKAQDGDSVGHLMRVTAEYGRWTGRVYSARDIAESLGWFAGAPAPPGPGAAGRWRGGGGGGGGGAGGAGGRLDAAALEDAGAPLLEVFLRQGASAAAAAAPRGPQQPPASLRAQPVYLWPGAAGGSSGGAAGAAATGAPGDARALLSVLGTSAAPPAPAHQALGSALLEDIVGSSLVVEEDEQILQALRDLDLGGLIDAAGPEGAAAAAAKQRPGADGSPGDGGAGEGDAAAAAAVLTVSVDEDGVATITAEDLTSAAEAAAAAAAAEQQRLLAEEEEQQRQQQAAAGAAGEGGGGVQLSRFDSQWELDEVEATLRELRGEAAAPPAGPTLPPPPPPVRTRPQPQGAPASPPPPQLAPAAAAAAAAPESWELQRHPADLIPLGRDRFVLVPREAPAAAAAAAAASSPSAAAAEALAVARPASPSPYDPRNAAAAAAASSPSAAPAGAAAGAFSALFSSTDEDEDDNLTEDQLWARVAEEVARIQEARSGIAVPRAELAEAIRTVARRLVREGRLPADAVPRVRIVAEPPSPASAARAAAAAAAAAAAPPAAPPAVTYTRLQGPGVGSGVGGASAAAAADPLSGLYLGSFGAHGPELLQLQRGVDEDGDECVVATKVTGDDNVPCGQVSFHAKVGRRHRLDTRSLYPEEMRVVARYAGQGRVADADFSDAQWVDGELLLFGGPPNPVTGGARVGFVWSVPDDRRFLILLTRVQLD